MSTWIDPVHRTRCTGVRCIGADAVTGGQCSGYAYTPSGLCIGCQEVCPVCGASWPNDCDGHPPAPEEARSAQG